MKGKRDESGKPQAPPKSNSKIQFGNNVMAEGKWDGYNFNPTWNASQGEQDVYNSATGKLPSLFNKASESQDFSSYVNNYTNNQLNNFNKSNKEALGNLAYTLGNSGVNGSVALEGLKPFAEATAKQISDIQANAPILANDLRTADQAYNQGNYNTAQNAINNYYNTGTGFTSQLQGLNQYADSVNQREYVDKYNKWLDETPLEYDGFLTPKWVDKLSAKAQIGTREFWTGDKKPYMSVNGYIPTGNTQGIGLPMLQTAATLAGTYLGGPTGGYMANKAVGSIGGNQKDRSAL